MSYNILGIHHSEKQYCHARGDKTGTPSYLHMCSTCAFNIQFTDDLFPRYTNEITCDDTDCDCMQAAKNIGTLYRLHSTSHQR